MIFLIIAAFLLIALADFPALVKQNSMIKRTKHTVSSLTLASDIRKITGR